MEITSSSNANETQREVAKVPTQLSSYDLEGKKLEKSGRRINACVTCTLIFGRCIDVLSSYIPIPFNYLKLILRLVAIGTAGDTLSQFLRTQYQTNQGVALWDPNSKLWPTILTLGVSVFTFGFASIILFAFFWGMDTVKRWDSRRATFAKFTTVLTTSLHVTSAVSMIQTGTDPTSTSLWNQACAVNPGTPKFDLFPNFNFSTFCVMQVLTPKNELWCVY